MTSRKKGAKVSVEEIWRNKVIKRLMEEEVED